MILTNIEINEYIKKEFLDRLMDKFETNFSSLYNPIHPYTSIYRIESIKCVIQLSFVCYICVIYTYGSTAGLKQYKCQTVRRLN